MSESYQLLARKGSGSFAIEVAFEESGVPYERIWINQDADQLARLKQITPAGKIPVLVFPDGSAMLESAAILLHLSLVYPQANLAPAPGTRAHATFLQWMVFMSANVYEAVLRMYYPARFSQRGDLDADAIRQQAVTDYLKHLAVIEPHLAPYVLGAIYSIADVYLYMLAAWYPDGKDDLYSRLPRLGELCARLARRTVIAKLDAEHAD